jgi:LacI family transcriptional regulator
MGIHVFENKQLEKIIKEIPFVVFDTYRDNKDMDFVVTDDFNGSYKAVKYMIGLNHKRIAYLSYPKIYTGQERLKGYKQALVDNNIDVDDKLIIESGALEENGYNTTKILLNKKNLPTGIFAFNDPVAWGAYKAIKEKGLKIPDDISLIGYADLPQSSLMDVPLTTVRQPRHKIGNVITERIIGRIEGKIKNNESNKVIVKTELVVRQSTRKL